MEMNMRLIGAPSVADLTTSLVDARGVTQHGHFNAVPADQLSLSVYDGLDGPRERAVVAKL
jgi:L-lactate dehydrogenase (cytochrome)